MPKFKVTITTEFNCPKDCYPKGSSAEDRESIEYRNLIDSLNISDLPSELLLNSTVVVKEIV